MAGLWSRRTVAALAGLAVLAVPCVAAAASAPTAVTGPVTDTGPASATVTGSVNPNGTATSWYVEYGTTTKYGSKTSATNAGSGTSNVPVSATLTGLNPGMTYHYRVVASSSAGTGTGADGLLSTSSAPVATTGAATDISTNAATLNGSVNPEGRPTSWYFDYGTSTSYGSKTKVQDAGSGASSVTVATLVSGLTAGKTYHFRLVASSDAGTDKGADRTFTPSLAPSVTTKPASSVGDTDARLNGAVVANGSSTTAWFEYGTSTGYGAKTPVQSIGSGTGSTNVSRSVSGLAAGTVYHFRLVASNGAGTTNGVDATFTTNGPPVPSTGTPSGITSSGATLNGTVDAAGHSTSWYFEYGTTTAYGTKTSPQGIGSGIGARSISVGIGGLNPATTYHARLVASSSAGTRQGADVVFTTAGPPITIAARGHSVVFGRRVGLSGALASKQTNATVTVFAQRFGGGSFIAIGTVLTGTGGVWTLRVRPVIQTSYKAQSNGATSATVVVGVHPAISLRVLTKGRFGTHVGAGASFARRVVQLQRRTSGGAWRTIARVSLDGASNATVRPRLPKGKSFLRVAMSVNQAGNGFLAGFSRTLLVRR